MFSLEKTLHIAFSDEPSFLSLRKAITNDLAISNVYYLKLAKFFDEFYTKHKELPKQGDVQLWLSTQGAEQKLALKSAYEHILNQNTEKYTNKFVVENVISALREKATQNAIKRMEATKNTSPEVMADMLDKVNEIKTATLKNVVDIRETAKWLRLEDDVNIKFKTGIQKLDSFIGGIGDELVFVMAGTGIGKTTFLINMAKSIASQGGNVLHITLELFDRATAHRYYRRISEATKPDFIHSYSDVKGLVDHWFKWVDGNVHIVYYPAFSINVDDVKNIVRQYVDEHGHVDMVILDYLDLLEGSGSSKYSDGWERLGRMSHEIRSLCPEYETAVASAAQANREGMDARTLKYKHMAGSVQKLQAADLVFGLMQTPEELEVNQGRLINLKVRESGGRGSEFPLYIDMDKMFMLDLDHPDSQRLIREEQEKQNALRQQIYA